MSARFFFFIGLAVCLMVARPTSFAQTEETVPKQETEKALDDTDEQREMQASEDSSAQQSNLEARVKELEAQVGQLTEKANEDELAQLVAEAEAEAKAPEDEEKPEEREFLWGALALQKLNPEISFSADMLLSVIIDDDVNLYAGVDDRNRISIREVGLHFQHV